MQLGSSTDPAQIHAIARDLRKVIHVPLEYEVLPRGRHGHKARGVRVLATPQSSGNVAGRLRPGAVVQGFPAGLWLHLSEQEVERLQAQGEVSDELQEGWVRLDARLTPCWAQVEVAMVFLEAVEFSWPGIPGEFVTYTVQWRLREAAQVQAEAADQACEGEVEDTGAEVSEAESSGSSQDGHAEDGGAAKGGSTECTSARALLHGLPVAAQIEVRVIAAVTGPEIDFAELFVTGCWTAIETASPLPEDNLEVLGDRDLLGGYRGGCLRSSCRGFLAATSLNSSHAEQCRRCGCSYEEHLELDGEPVPVKEPSHESAVKLDELPMSQGKSGETAKSATDEAVEDEFDEDSVQEVVDGEHDDYEDEEDETALAEEVCENQEGAEDGSTEVGGDFHEDLDKIDTGNARWEDFLAADEADHDTCSGLESQAAQDCHDDKDRLSTGFEAQASQDCDEDEDHLLTLGLDNDDLQTALGIPKSMDGDDDNSAAGHVQSDCHQYVRTESNERRESDRSLSLEVADEPALPALSPEQDYYPPYHAKFIAAENSGEPGEAQQAQVLPCEEAALHASWPAWVDADVDDLSDNGFLLSVDENSSLHDIASEIRKAQRVEHPWWSQPSVGTWFVQSFPLLAANCVNDDDLQDDTGMTAVSAEGSVVILPTDAARRGASSSHARFKVARCITEADNLQLSVAAPLEYRVVRQGGAVLRQAPERDAQELARLPQGSKLEGYCGGGWLRVTQVHGRALSGGWAFIGSQLAACCLETSVKSRFTEAMQVTWAGVPARLVGYSIEWKPAMEEVTSSDNTASRTCFSLKGETIVGGITPGTGEVCLRVVARVCSEVEGRPDIRILGPWSAPEALRPVTAVLQMPDANLDHFGNRRGSYADGKCTGFIRLFSQGRSEHPGQGDNDGGLPGIELICCARCGHEYKKHDRLRELSVQEAYVKAHADSHEIRVRSESADIEFKVKHAFVFVRDRANVKGKQIGMLTQGLLVHGRCHGSWLQLTRDSALSHGIFADSGAWVLVDGSEVGLGQLLVPTQVADVENRNAETKEDAVSFQAQDLQTLKQHEAGANRDAAFQGDTARIESAVAIEQASLVTQKLLGEALTYLVVEAAIYYSRPHENSVESGSVAQGVSIRGFPGSATWVRVVSVRSDQREVSHWIRRTFLRPQWCDLKVHESSEALDVTWPGLTIAVSHVSYSVEWRWCEENAARKGGRVLSLKPEASIAVRSSRGMELRACVLVQRGCTCLQLLGPWHAACQRDEPDDSAAMLPPTESAPTLEIDSERHDIVEELASAAELDDIGNAGQVQATTAGSPMQTSSISSTMFDFADLDAVEKNAGELYEVVYVGGVFAREAPSRQAKALGRLAHGQRVAGLLQGTWLRLNSDDTGTGKLLSTPLPPAELCEKHVWVLTDGKEIGLGPLLRRVAPDALTASAPSATGDTPKVPKESPEVPALHTPQALAPSEVARTESSEQKVSRLIRATKKASMLAQRVLAHPMEYEVVSACHAYKEPSTQAEKLAAELKVGHLIHGFPGSLAWVRLSGGQEGWVPMRSFAQSRDWRLSARWASLQAERVFSEALEVSWPGLTPPPSPYVAAYSVEWRLTPGEEPPIGFAGGRAACKMSGHALSLATRVILHGLPAGAAIQLRAGVRVASQQGSEADFRLLGPWLDFTTGSPLPEDEEAEAGRNIDPFGAPRGGCEASSCRGYVADVEAMSAAGPNASSMVSSAVCIRCGKSFDAHRRFDEAPKASKVAALRRDAIVSPEMSNARTYTVVHTMVFIRDRASVKGKTLGVLKQGDEVQGWPSSGWLRLAKDSSAPAATEHREAWVLIHGAEVGLGQLLEDVDGDKAYQASAADERHPAATGGPVTKSSVPAPQVDQVKLLQETASETRSVLPQPLEFDVVHEKPVPIRETPFMAARIVGELQPGSDLRGWPAGDWLKLAPDDKESDSSTDRWVVMASLASGQVPTLLEARWAAIAVEQAFEEALLLSWPGLPVAAAEYTLEWKVPGGASSGTMNVAAGKASSLLGGLPPGAAVSVRVRASIITATCPTGVKLRGHWSELRCLAPAPDTRVEAWRKGRLCTEYKAPQEIDGLEEVHACRRCGRFALEHAEAGRQQVSSTGEAKELEAKVKNTTFKVAVAVVYVRSSPSTSGAAVGFAQKGSQLSGEVQNGWLCLSPSCCQQLNLSTLQAFVATEGRFADRPDLGMLLQPLQSKSLAAPETAVAGHRSASEDLQQKNADSLRQRARRACQVLNGHALLFEVVSDKAVVHDLPDGRSALKSALQKGEQVRGYPSGSWLQLSSGSTEGWVQIENAAEGVLHLEAAWSKVHVRGAFLEALILEWPGLQLEQKVTYAVEWRVFADGEEKGGGHAVSKANKIHLTGLPPDGHFSMRVLACVTSSQVGVTPLRLNGPWIQAASLPAGQRPGRHRGSSVQSNVDPLGASRGGCQAGKCSGYIAPEDLSAGYVNDPRSALCRRCGFPFLEHRKGGELSRKTAGGDAGSRFITKALSGNQRSKFPATYIVQHRAVLLRSKPSVQADKLGIVCKGQVLKGYEMEGWLQLTKESSAQAGAQGGKLAWALIDGQEVGLGVLLRPVKPGEKLPSLQEDSDDETQSSSSWQAEAVYLTAVEFEVIFKSVAIRRRPKVSAKSLGIMKEGERVWGYPKENWLRTVKKYRQKDHGWVCIDGTTLGHGLLLQCTMLKPCAVKCFAEALQISWQHLPVKSAAYKLEWMAKDQKKVHTAVERTKANTGRIQGLEPNSTYFVRVTAFVLMPGLDERSPKSVCAQVVSEWVPGDTGAPVDVTEESNMTFDPLAKLRGKCQDCKHCNAFILSKYSYLMRLDEVSCRRCGCPCTSHVIVGEYGKSQSQWHKEKAERRRQDEQRRQTGYYKKPMPAMQLEIQSRSWHPDDAPVGASKAKYVIKEVSQAQNLYERLGVKPSALAKDIRNAYRQISLRIHPDKVQSSGGAEDADLHAEAEAAFKLVSSAYEILGDEGKRAAYNHTLRPTSKSHAASGKPREPRTTAPSAGAGQRERWPGGPDKPRMVEVTLTVSHAISDEDPLRMTMNRGTTVMGLKRAMCKRLKRGPPESIDICDQAGCVMEDDHRFGADEELYCVGISLGPAKLVSVEVRDYRTGARLFVEVLDTSSIDSLRKKVAKELSVKEKEFQVGQQKGGGKTGASSRFEGFASEELLNGRRTVYIQGNNVLIYLSLEQALKLQRDLIRAYSTSVFQSELAALLKEYPMPQSLSSMKFREAFGKIVRQAQKATLARWGFDGDFAAQNMMAAFGKVAHTPEVYELSLEIDKLLRITTGGMIAGPTRQKKEEKKAAPKEKQGEKTKLGTKTSPPKPPVTITVRQAVEEDDDARGAPKLKVTVAAESTMRKVKQAIADKLGLKRAATIKLVFALHGKAKKAGLNPDSGMTFASFKDDELIGSRREVLMMGADLREAHLAGRTALGEEMRVTISKPSSSRQVVQLLQELQLALKEHNFGDVLDKMDQTRASQDDNWGEASNELFATSLTKVWGATLAKHGFSDGEDGFQAMFGLVAAFGKREMVRRSAHDLEKSLRFAPGDFFGLPPEDLLTGGLTPERAEELLRGMHSLLKTEEFQGQMNEIDNLADDARRHCLGMHFVVACQELVSDKFGYKAGKDGFGKMFEDVWEHREDPTVSELAEQCEGLMRVPKGSWFGFSQRPGSEEFAAAASERMGNRTRQLMTGAGKSTPAQVDLQVELSELARLPDCQVTIAVSTNSTALQVKQAVALKLLQKQAGEEVPERSNRPELLAEVEEVARQGSLAAAIGQSIALDLLRDDELLGQRSRLLWVGDGLTNATPELVDRIDAEELQLIFPDAEQDLSAESPGGIACQEALREEASRGGEDLSAESHGGIACQEALSEEASQHGEALREEQAQRGEDLSAESPSGEIACQEVPGAEAAQRGEDLSAESPPGEIACQEGLGEEAAKSAADPSAESPGEIACQEALDEEASQLGEELSAESPGEIACQEALGEEAVQRGEALGEEASQCGEDDERLLPDATGALKLLAVLPESASDWQVQVLDDLLRLAGCRAVRASEGEMSGDVTARRSLKLSSLLPSSLPQAEQAEGERIDEEAPKVEVEVKSLTAEGPGGSLTLSLPRDGTVGNVRELVTARCGGGGVAAHIRMVRRFSDTLFLPLRDEEALGSRRELLLLGVDLAGVDSSTEKGDERQSACDESAEGFDPEGAEAAGLLMAAMELLEEPAVLEALVELDQRRGGLLAAWEPPWTAQGLEELEAAALAALPADTVIAWAKSFAALVEALGKDSSEVLDVIPKEMDLQAAKEAKPEVWQAGEAEQLVEENEPEMEPEHEPEQEDAEDGEEVVMVELEHAFSGQRVALAVPACSLLGQVKTALGQALGLHNAIGLQLLEQTGANAPCSEDERLCGRQKLFFLGPQDDATPDVAETQQASNLAEDDEEVIDLPNA
eukprot:TRINITY_DN14065_c0_g1_i2.p1 TRINITY_DN14065_c0_g1~~TRINITY_DN14065_c0_g1_i2.p1  ORF type:complete len:4450 (-),score=994.04 TRINITY_DN14065_c0_g1_i2:41-13390(-)